MAYIIEPCASAKSFEIMFGKGIVLEKLEKELEKTKNSVLSSTNIVLLAKINGKPVSVYASGRAMVKEATKKETEKIAEILCLSIER